MRCYFYLFQQPGGFSVWFQLIKLYKVNGNLNETMNLILAASGSRDLGPLQDEGCFRIANLFIIDVVPCPFGFSIRDSTRKDRNLTMTASGVEVP